MYVCMICVCLIVYAFNCVFGCGCGCGCVCVCLIACVFSLRVFNCALNCVCVCVPGGRSSKVMKLLLGVYGAEFAVTAGNGSTPLHWAASKGKRAIIEILVGIFCAQVKKKKEAAQQQYQVIRISCVNVHRETSRNFLSSNNK